MSHKPRRCMSSPTAGVEPGRSNGGVMRLVPLVALLLLSGCGDSGDSGGTADAEVEPINCEDDAVSCEPMDPSKAIDLGEFTAEQVAEAAKRFEYSRYARGVEQSGGTPLSYERWEAEIGPIWVRTPKDIEVGPFPKPPPSLEIPTCIPMVRRGPKGLPLLYCR